MSTASGCVDIFPCMNDEGGTYLALLDTQILLVPVDNLSSKANTHVDRRYPNTSNRNSISRFPSISNAAPLLSSMKDNSSFQVGAPSDEVSPSFSTLKTRILTHADISEDDNNASWGIVNCRAGLLYSHHGTTLAVLVFACRLIATVIKTCKVPGT